MVIAIVEPKGPLGKAGFEEGDIILAIDHQPVKGMEGFASLVSSLKANQKITLLALDHRTGNTGTIRVEVRERKGEEVKEQGGSIFLGRFAESSPL